MKFLVDAQLPRTLSEFLKQKGLDSIHTLDLPGGNRTIDRRIAEMANEEGRFVVTKDVDFLESYIVKAEPAKLILIRTGNITNVDLIKIFDANLETLLEVISRSNLVEVNTSEIIELGS